MKAGDLGGYIEFQSTLPRRERLYSTVPIAGAVLFQSTLPRRERRAGRELWNDKTRISIHAPTKGATVTAISNSPPASISIHAPTKGATQVLIVAHNLWALFQSTLPRRERQSYAVWPAPLSSISIHAPTKGATFLLLNPLHFCLFQSTLPRRERPSRNRGHCEYTIFQSTLPRRERLLPAILMSISSNFNPRSHEGSDGPRSAAPCFDFIISIHAPTKGATGSDDTLQYCPSFQSTLPRRERLMVLVELHGVQQFQSTLPRRERPSAPLILLHA